MSIQWSLVLFSLLAGAGGCLFAFVGTNELTGWSKKKTLVPSIVALALLIVGGFASVTHLSHPTRIMNALSHPTSGIFVEAVLIGLTILAIVIYLVCVQRKLGTAVKAFGIIGGILGLLFSFMAGHSYMMEAREAWNNMLLPLSYMITDLAVGAGLWWALCAPGEDNGFKPAACATVVCTTLALLCVCAYALVTGALTAGNVIAISCIACAVLAVALAAIGCSKLLVALAWSTMGVATVTALLFRVLMWVLGSGAYSFFA